MSAATNAVNSTKPTALSEIDSLPEKHGLPDYPLDALGPLAPVAAAIAEHIQAPTAIAAHAVLGVASLVAQQLANVRQDGLESPLSLFLLCIAGSGDRKSSCDRQALKPVNEHIKNLHETYKNEVKSYADASEVYKKEYREALRDNPANLADLQEPDPPVQPILLMQEPTLESIQKSLKYGQPSQGIFSDEAAQFFGGHALDPKNAQKTIAGLSKFWDGDDVHRSRSTEGQSFSITDRRLCVNLMAQPVITAEVLSNKLYQEQGILARFLVADTESLAGTRMYQASDIASDPSYQQYYSRVLSMLTAGYELDQQGGLVLQTIGFDSTAAELIRRFYNEVETLQGEERELAVIKPFASKIAEHVRRLAGVMAVYSDESIITESVAKNAIVLGSYYLNVILHSVRQSAADAEEYRLADVLAWLREQTSNTFKSRDLQRESPPRLGMRNSATGTRRAMGMLVERGYLTVLRFDRSKQAAEWGLSDA